MWIKNINNHTDRESKLAATAAILYFFLTSFPNKKTTRNLIGNLGVNCKSKWLNRSALNAKIAAKEAILTIFFEPSEPEGQLNRNLVGSIREVCR